MRRFTVTMAILIVLIDFQSVIPAQAETRQALEAEARQYGAPMAWVPDGAFMMGIREASSRATPVHRVYLYAFLHGYV